MSIAEFEDWLLQAAGKEAGFLETFEAFLWRMPAAALPIDYAGLYVGTLHPLLLGVAWTWRRASGICDELEVDRSATRTDNARRSPLWQVLTTGEALRRDPRDPLAQAEFPFLLELAAEGFTDYHAMPLGAARFRYAITYATRSERRLDDAQIAQVRRLVFLFALHVERHIVELIADNTLRAYIGSLAAQKVLDGTIRRGKGESVYALIWVSDLRGFTELLGRVHERDAVEIVNAYFEIFADAVLSHGGEVLKFVGDGMLAIFRLGDDGNRAARLALDGARFALAELAKLNDEPPAHLREIEGWRPLRAGIALHEGEVFLGNVGARERLDFTVIGSAVNEASRVEALNKTIGRGILITEKAARRIGVPMRHLGRHMLRGLADAVAIYEPD